MRNTAAARLSLLVGLLLGAVASRVVPSAWASRNSSGTYSLPSGNPVTSGATITTSWANNTLSDISTELTNSLDRQGRGAMSGPLQCSSGSAAAPSLTFSGDTDTGMYRVGANDIGITTGGVLRVHQSATTLTALYGLVVTQANTNGDGLAVTGNGSGYGARFTGGPTDGQGAYGLGGGTGTGLQGTGGASGGTGVEGQGQGAGFGGEFTGGPTAGTGIQGTGGTNNGKGGEFTGTGTAAGVNALGGATGDGITAAAGGSPTANTNTRYALNATGGHIKLGGGNPTSTTGFANTLTPTNFIKSWGRLTSSGAGALTVTSGFNVSTAACGGTGNDDFVVTLTTGFTATTSYVVIPAYNIASGTDVPQVTPVSATQFRINWPLHPCDTVAFDTHFIAVGLQ